MYDIHVIYPFSFLTIEYPNTTPIVNWSNLKTADNDSTRGALVIINLLLHLLQNTYVFLQVEFKPSGSHCMRGLLQYWRVASGATCRRVDATEFQHARVHPSQRCLTFIVLIILSSYFFMPPPFEEWWRALSVTPVRASVSPCVRPKFGVRSITFERLHRFNSNLVCWYMISKHRLSSIWVTIH